MSLKNIYLIVGPSGSGKTTIANELKATYGYKAVESYTTRPPRYEGERGHIFVSDEEFDALGPIIERTQQSLEHATEYIGFLYDKYKQLQKAHKKLQRKKSDSSWDEEIRLGQVQGMW